jgi:hypothetical protein
LGLTSSVLATKGRQPITSGSNYTGFRNARVRAGLLKLRWRDLRHTWATWHAQAGTPAIVLQALGGWKDARTYTHLAALDLLDHANAIRLPTIPLSAGTNRPQWRRRTTGKTTKRLMLLGWTMGFEPTTTGITMRPFTQYALQNQALVTGKDA